MEVCKRSKPYMLMVLLQTGYAFNGLIGDSALKKGMNHYTFTVYRNAFAALVFSPFALIFERKLRPKLTMSIFFKIMILGLLEPVMDQNLYYAGMDYTNATFAAAMCNILPAITFIMAWIFRLEKVSIKSKHSQGKMLGTIVTVGGAMIMTLIKGPPVRFPWTNSTQASSSSSTSIVNNHEDQLKGSLMLIAGCFSWATFVILQAFTLKSYPVELSLAALICAAGALQGTILTFVIEKTTTSIWSLHWDIQLLAIIYGGIMCSGVSYYVSGLIMKERGPVFVTAFNPLCMIIVALVASFILSQQLDLGRVLGAIVIVVGLYLVLWGKSEDQNLSNSDMDEVGLSADKLISTTEDRGDGKSLPKHDCVNVSQQASFNLQLV